MEAGVHVNNINNNVNSALVLAEERGHTSIVNLLREVGAEKY